MKRLSIVFIFFYLCLNVFSAGPVRTNVDMCSYVSFAWGKWIRVSTCVTGTYDEFCLHPNEEHPWNYYFKVKITNYHTPTKEEIKAYKKENKWVEYIGTVEYSIDDKYPTLIDALKEFNRPLMQEDHSDWDYGWKKPMIRKKETARIRFVPSKKGPKSMNIWVGNIAIGIDLNKCLPR